MRVEAVWLLFWAFLSCSSTPPTFCSRRSYQRQEGQADMLSMVKRPWRGAEKEGEDASIDRESPSFKPVSKFSACRLQKTCICCPGHLQPAQLGGTGRLPLGRTAGTMKS